eukprot:3633757-Pyramimonas_sp.AAC.1
MNPPDVMLGSPLSVAGHRQHTPSGTGNWRGRWKNHATSTKFPPVPISSLINSRCLLHTDFGDVGDDSQIVGSNATTDTDVRESCDITSGEYAVKRRPQSARDRVRACRKPPTAKSTNKNLARGSAQPPSCDNTPPVSPREIAMPSTFALAYAEARYRYSPAAVPVQ